MLTVNIYSGDSPSRMADVDEISFRMKNVREQPGMYSSTALFNMISDMANHCLACSIDKIVLGKRFHFDHLLYCVNGSNAGIKRRALNAWQRRESAPQARIACTGSILAALLAGIAAAASPTPQATREAKSTSIGSSCAANMALPSGLLNTCENTTSSA